MISNKSIGGNAVDLLKEHEKLIKNNLSSIDTIKEFLLPNVDTHTLTSYIKKKLDKVSA